jgi:outer membrane protein assembly factor BamB
VITSVPNANSIIIQGFSNSTPQSVYGVVNLNATTGTTYWTINMTIDATGSYSSTTYTIYYYALT